MWSNLERSLRNVSERLSVFIIHKPKAFYDPAKYNQELFTMPKITIKKKKKVMIKSAI